MADTFDYIVVGAGSGGCVVTQRLVAAGKSVLLLEAGPADNTPFIHMPATFIRVIGTKRTWMYETEAEDRSEEHTSELQSLMRNSYAVFCLKKKKTTTKTKRDTISTKSK